MRRRKGSRSRRRKRPRASHQTPRRACQYARRLIVMARVPAAGQVKTRLAREIGVARAAAFYRNTTAALLQRVSDRTWRIELAITPDSGRAARCWPTNIVRVPQGGGDLGARMQRLFDAAGKGPLVIIGTDIPAIRRSHIAAAFRALRGHDAVLGPACDGGYWLIGLKRAPRKLRPFARVRWSSAHALEDTLRNLDGARIATLPTLSDIDGAVLPAAPASTGSCGVA